jgi:hypothetical protein
MSKLEIANDDDGDALACSYPNYDEQEWIVPSGCSYTSGYTITLTFTTFDTESGVDQVRSR